MHMVAFPITVNAAWRATSIYNSTKTRAIYNVNLEKTRASPTGNFKSHVAKQQPFLKPTPTPSLQPNCHLKGQIARGFGMTFTQAIFKAMSNLFLLEKLTI